MLSLKNIFLVMDYVPVDLNQVLKEPPKDKNQDSLVTIIYNSLRSLKFLHATGVMHRDIKPANLLIM